LAHQINHSALGDCILNLVYAANQSVACTKFGPQLCIDYE
jgi:hypothetical protein